MRDLSEKYVLAADLGGTKILLGLIDEHMNILNKKSILTEKEKGSEQAIDKLVNLCIEMCNEQNINLKDCTLSLCAPGPVDVVQGSMVESVNFDWGIVPIRDILEQRLSIPAIVEHDAKASALGEYHYGLGKGEKNMVYIVVGTGVGGAIILDGKLYRGMHNFAGEMGHFTIDYDGDPGMNEIKGNVQSFLSGPALILNYEKYLKSSGLPVPQNIDGKILGDLAHEGDEAALNIIHNAGTFLGIAVASLAMILDIELFVIGSSVAKLGEMFLEPARQSLPKYCFSSIAQFVRIQASTLGDNAALLGCFYNAKFINKKF